MPDLEIIYLRATSTGKWPKVGLDYINFIGSPLPKLKELNITPGCGYVRPRCRDVFPNIERILSTAGLGKGDLRAVSLGGITRTPKILAAEASAIFRDYFSLANAKIQLIRLKNRRWVECP